MKTTLCSLAATALLLLPSLTACDDAPNKAPSAPKERSQAVVAAATAPVATPANAVVPAAAPAAPKERPVLCAQQLGKPGKDAPGAPLSRAGDKGRLADRLTLGEAWTWINLWAAWCVPCKQEMPILRGWEKDLAGERAPLRVLFVSLDDDPRQLDAFLASEPATGLKATYWLEDGPRRTAWLEEAGFDGEPELPAHLLVDPSGKVRCVVQGAIEQSDFVEVQKIVRGQRGGAGAGQGAKAATPGNRKGKKP